MVSLYHGSHVSSLSSESLRDDLRRALPPLAGPSEPPAGEGGRPAAVLVPLVDREEPSLVFTKRTEDLPRHPGEISFPGGLRHDEDRDLLETALRETEEELGLAREDVEILGAIQPFLTYTTGFWVMPFVGWLTRDPAFAPSPAEIAAVLEFPVRVLSEVEREVEWRREGWVWTGFVYEVEGHTIWGATGRMLHEFLEIVRKEPSWPKAG
jgi:8-oxo-dGTP pyrophosphatase MutT (NUDIX family)